VGEVARRSREAYPKLSGRSGRCEHVCRRTAQENFPQRVVAAIKLLVQERAATPI